MHPRCNGGLSTAVAGAVEALVLLQVRCGIISFDGWRPRPGGYPAPFGLSVVEAMRWGVPARPESSSPLGILRR